MARKALSVAQAKASLSDAIRDVEAGSTVVITRHGKAVAALVRAEDLTMIERLRAVGPEQGLASLAGGWKGSEELVAAVEARPRKGRRPVPSLD